MQIYISLFRFLLKIIINRVDKLSWYFRAIFCTWLLENCSNFSGMNNFSIFSIYYFIDRNHDFQLFLILGETNLIKEGTSLLLLLLGNKTFQIELYLYNNYNVRKVKVFVSSSIFFFRLLKQAITPSLLLRMMNLNCGSAQMKQVLMRGKSLGCMINGRTTTSGISMFFLKKAICIV